MISFFLPGDWLGAALGSTWLSVEKLAKPDNVVEWVTNTDAQKFYIAHMPHIDIPILAVCRMFILQYEPSLMALAPTRLL